MSLPRAPSVEIVNSSTPTNTIRSLEQNVDIASDIPTSVSSVAETGIELIEHQSIENNEEIESELFRSNTKFRKYSLAIHRLSSSFDSIAEWPDIITFLSKIVRLIQSHSEFRVIPYKFDISRRLSQALNPSLPNGVHQKALESFMAIFDIIGPENLVRDAMLWTFGLFPYFSCAQMSVKPTVLQIVHKFFIPLGRQMEPLLSHLIIGLLPNLDEEDNEFFDPNLALMESISNAVDKTFFLDCVLAAITTNSSIRKAGLTLLSRKFLNDIDPSRLVAHALSACLSDSTLLVKRLSLDILISRFQFSNLDGFKSDEIEMLVTCTAHILLTREMSLNRRVYSWILGTSDEYYADFAHVHVSRCLLHGLTSKSVVERVKAFKVFVNFLDKKILAALCVQDLMEPMIFDLYRSLTLSVSDAEKLDLLANANMFFRMIDPYLIWKPINQFLMNNHNDALKLIIFASEKIDNKETECQSMHIPMTILNLTLKLLVKESTYNYSEIIKVIEFILPRASFTPENIEFDSVSDNFYTEKVQTYLSGNYSYTGVSKSEIGNMFHKISMFFVQQKMIDMLSQSLSFLADRFVFKQTVCFNKQVIKYISDRKSEEAASCCKILLLTYILRNPDLVPTSNLKTILQCLLNILEAGFNRTNFFMLAALIWTVVSIDESNLSRILVDFFTKKMNCAAGFEVFGVFWKNCRDQDKTCFVLSRPLLLVVDGLRRPHLSPIADNWIHSYLVSYKHFVDPIFKVLCDDSIKRRLLISRRSIKYFEYEQDINFQLISYNFDLLLKILQVSKEEIFPFLQTWNSDKQMSYADFLLETAALYLRSFYTIGECNSEIQIKAAKVIKSLLRVCSLTEIIIRETVAPAFLDSLNICVERGLLELQDVMLEIFVNIGRYITPNDPKSSSGKRVLTFQSSASVQDIFATRKAEHFLEERLYSNSLFEVLIMNALTLESNRPVLPLYISLLRTKLIFMVPIMDQIASAIFEQFKYSFIEALHENRFVLYLRALQMLFEFSFSQGANSNDPPSPQYPTISSTQSATGSLGSTEEKPAESSSPIFDKEFLDRKKEDVASYLLFLLPQISEFTLLCHKKTKSATHNDFSQTCNDIFMTACIEKLREFAELIGVLCLNHWVEALVFIWNEKKCSINEIIHTSSLEAAVLYEIAMNNALAKQKRRLQYLPKSANVSIETSLSFLVALQAENGDQLFETRDNFLLFASDLVWDQSKHLADILSLSTSYSVCAITATPGDLETHKKCAFVFRRIIQLIISNCQCFGFRKESSFMYIPIKRIANKKQRDLSDQDYINTHYALRVLMNQAIPNAQVIFGDSEQLGLMLSELLNEFVFDGIRQENMPDLFMDALGILDKIGFYSAHHKLWKKEVWDYFISQTFFPLNPPASLKLWKNILPRYMRDTLLITELISSIGATQGNALFSSKDSEHVLTCHSIRHLSFLLWCAPVDEFAPYMPQIQEKIPTLLPTPSAEVTFELFLLLRVCILRFRDAPLARLWTCIIVEIVRILRSFATRDGTHTRQSLHCLLAICKFLDFANCLRLPDLQIYRGVFVNCKKPGSGLLWDLFCGFENEINQFLEEKKIDSLSKYDSPIIVASCIKSPIELLDFARHVSYCNFNEPVMINYEAVHCWIEADLVESVFKKMQ